MSCLRQDRGVPYCVCVCVCVLKLDGEGGQGLYLQDICYLKHFPSGIVMMPFTKISEATLPLLWAVSLAVVALLVLCVCVCVCLGEGKGVCCDPISFYMLDFGSEQSL